MPMIHSNLTANRSASKVVQEFHRKGYFTSRGLSDWHFVLGAANYSMDRLLSNTMNGTHAYPDRSVLELGCGEAHALLEILRTYPDARAECVNSLVYARETRACFGPGNCGNGATTPTRGEDGSWIVSDESWRAAATAFSIPVLPRWPHVVFGDYSGGITDRNGATVMSHPLPWNASSFNLVMSQNALNEGKINVPHHEFPALVADVIRVLRMDGVGIFQCHYDRTPYQYSRQYHLSTFQYQQRRANTTEARNDRSKMIEAVEFPLAGLLYEDSKTRQSYRPLDFASELRVGGTGCVDILSFVGATPPEWNKFSTDAFYVMVRKRACANSTLASSACTRWRWAHINVSAYIKGNYIDHYDGVTSDMITGGTECLD
jgi:SAM-dependent methyltransferase